MKMICLALATIMGILPLSTGLDRNRAIFLNFLNLIDDTLFCSTRCILHIARSFCSPSDNSITLASSRHRRRNVEKECHHSYRQQRQFCALKMSLPCEHLHLVPPHPFVTSTFYDTKIMKIRSLPSRCE